MAPGGMQRCRWCSPGTPQATFLLESKSRAAAARLGPGQPLCNRSSAAALRLAGTHRGLDKLEMLLSSELGLLGPRGAAGRRTWRLSLIPSVPSTSCLAVPEAVPGLAGMLQRGEVGAGPRPREPFLEETAAVCTPVSCCPPVPTSPRGWHTAMPGTGLSQGQRKPSLGS